jgi:FMN phosphatase YigB (HAD superfamily)
MNNTIVFDLDGTLITCENKQKYALYAILNCTGGISSDSLDRWWHLKREGNSTEQALTGIGIRNEKLIREKWIETIENLSWHSLDRPFNDSIPTLDFLRTGHNINLVILTARTNKYLVQQAISTYGFSGHIDDLIVVTPANVAEDKAIFLKKINPLVFVGDTETDHQASVRSGIRFVALCRGQRSRKFLERNGVPEIEDDLKFVRDENFHVRMNRI